MVDVPLADRTVVAFDLFPGFPVVTVSSAEVAEVAGLDSCTGLTDVVCSSFVVAEVVVCRFIVVVTSSFVVVGSLLVVVRATLFGSAPVVVCFTGSRVSVKCFVERVESTDAAVTMMVTFPRCKY